MFGADLKSFRGGVGIGLGSVWDRFGVGLGVVWDGWWVGLGSVRGQLEIDLCTMMWATVVNNFNVIVELSFDEF